MTYAVAGHVTRSWAEPPAGPDTIRDWVRIGIYLDVIDFEHCLEGWSYKSMVDEWYA